MKRSVKSYNNVVSTVKDRPVMSRAHEMGAFPPSISLWISSSVYREKPDGSLGVCIDSSQTVRKAIEIPKCPIPTVDELLPRLNNAKVFSCGDVYKGFTNIELD